MRWETGEAVADARDFCEKWSLCPSREEGHGGQRGHIAALGLPSALGSVPWDRVQPHTTRAMAQMKMNGINLLMTDLLSSLLCRTLGRLRQWRGDLPESRDVAAFRAGFEMGQV
jgi:hypothetical protein